MDLRILLFDLVQFFHGLVIDRYIRRTLRLFQGKAGDLPPIHQGHGALFRVLVPYVSNVTKPDGPPAPDGDLRLSQRICILRIAQHANGLPRPRNFGAAPRRLTVDLTKWLIDLRRCVALSLQLTLVRASGRARVWPSFYISEVAVSLQQKVEHKI